ncbi:unnamed protein product [Closterium sp. Naga37s-1]|nr:unnamed protein product [Closterium sp. Naga37s-1]
MAPHTAIYKLATPSHASARFNIRHMVSMGSLPVRVGGGAIGASRGKAADRPGARPNENCGAWKPGACRTTQQIADAAETARGVQSPSDGQATPCPASPEIAAESAERGIVLVVSNGLPDLNGTGAKESDDAQGTADHPLRAGELRDAQESGAEGIAAAEADAAASARAPVAADQQGGLTQLEQAPTSTLARMAARRAEEEESARSQSGGRAHLRRGAQRNTGEDQQAPSQAPHYPQSPLALDCDPLMGSSLPIPPPPTPACRQSKDDVVVAPQTRRIGAAGGRGTWGIRVGRSNGRRARRGNGRGRRGGRARRTGASAYARTAERLLREGMDGGEEVASDETNLEVEDAENEESDVGDPLGPLLFAASIHPCLVATAAAHPQVVLLAYADDITLLGEAPACSADFDHLTAALTTMGLLHKSAKCAAWSAAPIDPAFVPPGITISSEGLQILGSPIGTPQGCVAAVRDRLTAAAEPLPLLAQIDPLLCLLLLTRCVSRRASFLAGTTPLEVLPEAEWSA